MSAAVLTRATHPDRRFQFLEDYCPECNPLGHNAARPIRLASLTTPEAVTWPGGTRLICEYRCDHCGHQWRRPDLWTAESAGFDPRQEIA